LLEVVREIIAWRKQNPPSTDAPEQIETYATEMSDEVDPESETNSVLGMEPTVLSYHSLNASGATPSA
jgi:hypothetical protein